MTLHIFQSKYYLLREIFWRSFYDKNDNEQVRICIKSGSTLCNVQWKGKTNLKQEQLMLWEVKWFGNVLESENGKLKWQIHEGNKWWVCRVWVGHRDYIANLQHLQQHSVQSPNSNHKHAHTLPSTHNTTEKHQEKEKKRYKRCKVDTKNNIVDVVGVGLRAIVSTYRGYKELRSRGGCWCLRRSELMNLVLLWCLCLFFVLMFLLVLLFDVFRIGWIGWVLVPRGLLFIGFVFESLVK
jgi:hypothetical protein